MTAKTSEKASDRAMGAIIGTFIGDALGLGCHWYYDLAAFKADCGEWISNYMTSKADRKDMFAKVGKYRHEIGLKAGDVSQTGQVALLLLESIAEKSGYNESDFTLRMDSLLSTLDGSAFSGRYTDWAMRDVWQQRKKKIGWDKTGSRADTAEAAMRSTLLAALLFSDPEHLAETAYQNILLTHREPYIVAQSLSFTLTVAGLISNASLPNIGNYLGKLYAKQSIKSVIPSFDCLNQAKNGAQAVSYCGDIEPASRVCSLYGLACSLGFMLPAAYYFIHRYPEDFETAVLSAINGGGNNMARAALTGALSGAMVGLKGIPERFIQGLADHDRLLEMTGKVASS
jgi:ADP-ribosyl-[dinitrogen reductase] hydrolase